MLKSRSSILPHIGIVGWHFLSDYPISKVAVYVRKLKGLVQIISSPIYVSGKSSILKFELS